jgi:hypothetical protein
MPAFDKLYFTVWVKDPSEFSLVSLETRVHPAAMIRQASKGVL